MTADVINLRRARKSRERAMRAEVAAANRVAHGRSRFERDTAAIETLRADRLLEGHRLMREPVRPDPDGDDA